MLNPVKGKGRVLEEKLVGCCVGRRWRCMQRGEAEVKFEEVPPRGKDIIRCLNRA